VVGVEWVDASRDRPDANIAVIDVPAIRPWMSAEGEGGHALLKSDRGKQAIIQRVREQGGATADPGC
jgi:hypothetical protein